MAFIATVADPRMSKTAIMTMIMMNLFAIGAAILVNVCIQCITRTARAFMFVPTAGTITIRPVPSAAITFPMRL
jgi:hypothetical protein